MTLRICSTDVVFIHFVWSLISLPSILCFKKKVHVAIFEFLVIMAGLMLFEVALIPMSSDLGVF